MPRLLFLFAVAAMVSGCASRHGATDEISGVSEPAAVDLRRIVARVDAALRAFDLPTTVMATEDWIDRLEMFRRICQAEVDVRQRNLELARRGPGDDRGEAPRTAVLRWGENGWEEATVALRPEGPALVHDTTTRARRRIDVRVEELSVMVGRQLVRWAEFSLQNVPGQPFAIPTPALIDEVVLAFADTASVVQPARANRLLGDDHREMARQIGRLAGRVRDAVDQWDILWTEPGPQGQLRCPTIAESAKRFVEGLAAWNRTLVLYRAFRTDVEPGVFLGWRT